MHVYDPVFVAPVPPKDYRGFLFAWIGALQRRRPSLPEPLQEWTDDAAEYDEGDRYLMFHELTRSEKFEISKELWWAVLCEAEHRSMEHGKEVHDAANALDQR